MKPHPDAKLEVGDVVQIGEDYATGDKPEFLNMIGTIKTVYNTTISAPDEYDYEIAFVVDGRSGSDSYYHNEIIELFTPEEHPEYYL